MGMDHLNQRILTLLPEGSEVLEYLYNFYKNRTLAVKYRYNGAVEYRRLTRVDLKDIFPSPLCIILREGLTVNDIYEIYSKESNINLIKGEDYDDNETVITSPQRFYLKLSPYSLRFRSSDIYVQIVDPAKALISDEKTRNLFNMSSNPFKEGFEKELRKLGLVLFNGKDFVCFDQNTLTLDFRNLVISTLDKNSEYYEVIRDDILTAKIIHAFTDGVSDAVMLEGNSKTIFWIRFVSNIGDLPFLN